MFILSVASFCCIDYRCSLWPSERTGFALFVEHGRFLVGDYFALVLWPLLDCEVMQLNRYILASKAHVKCMYAWLNSYRQRFLFC